MRFLLVLVLTGVAAGQVPDLFAVPGEVTNAPPEVIAYSTNPFARVGAIPTQPYVTLFRAHPDGSRFYAISRLGPDGVRVISTVAPYPELKRLPVLDTQAAAISSDGRRLVLVRSNFVTQVNAVTIVDLSTDTVVADVPIPGSLRPQVAISADSARAFVLTNGASVLYAVDLVTNMLVPDRLQVPAAVEVRAGPNGLIYLASFYKLNEIDGRTLRPWDLISPSPQRNVTSVELTRDGEYAVSNGDLFHLPTRQVTPLPAGGLPVVELGARRAIVGRNDIDWSGAAAEPVDKGQIPDSIGAAIATNEFPSARYLISSVLGQLRRFPLVGSLGANESLSITPSILQYEPRPGSGTPANVSGMQTRQTLRRSERPRPLVARVSNAAGKFLPNVAVSFQSSLVSTVVQTDFQGNAVLNLPAGYAPGSYSVVATVGALPPVTYHLTVEEDLPAARQLTVVTGFGEFDVGSDFFGDTSPISVRVTDSTGRPLSRATVVFRTASGRGTMIPEYEGKCNGGECTVWTDSQGMATVVLTFPAERFQISGPEVETIVITSGGARVEVVRTILPAWASVTLEKVLPAEDRLGGLAGASLPGGFRVRTVFIDGFGNKIPLASVRVRLETSASEGPITFCDRLSDASGNISCDIRLPDVAGRWLSAMRVGRGQLMRFYGAITVTTYTDQPQVELSPPAPPESPLERTIEVTALRPGTETPFGILNLLINSALDGRQACYVAYSIRDAKLYLVNDEGPQAGLSAPLTLGSDSTVANSQCTVMGASSSFTGTSSRPVLRVRIRFALGFGGQRIVHVASRTQDDAESSGWQVADVLTLPSGQTVPGLGINPMSQSRVTTSASTLDFQYVGSSSFMTVWGLIGSSLDARSGCAFAYYTPGNLITLYPDNGIPTGTMVPFSPGAVLENSRCRLKPLQAVRASNGLLLRMEIISKPEFAGAKAIWGAASTLENTVSPWTPVAAWQVRAPYF